MADIISQGAMQVSDTEVHLFNITDEAAWDVDYLNDSKTVIFGTPTYYANMCWQMKKWFDTSGDKIQLGWEIGLCFFNGEQSLWRWRRAGNHDSL